MTTPSTHDVTRLLVAWSDGDQAALEKLMPLVYQELRRLARRYLGRENPGHTLQPTALVNEAYLRLIDQNRVRWQNRAHFFGVSAQLMRRILVDMARARQPLSNFIHFPGTPTASESPCMENTNRENGDSC
jgi:RNA polymerase sigma factor (TIGR02999 family)